MHTFSSCLPPPSVGVLPLLYAFVLSPTLPVQDMNAQNTNYGQFTHSASMGFDLLAFGGSTRPTVCLILSCNVSNIFELSLFRDQLLSPISQPCVWRQLTTLTNCTLVLPNI